jgi:molybdate transport system permease protein
MGQATPHQADAEEAPRGRVPANPALIRRSLAGAAVFAAAAVALGFLLLPIVAIFARVSPGTLVAQLSRPVVTDALLLSLKANVIAQALVLLFGTPLAYVLATRRFPGRSLAIVLVELPLVLPPAVAGMGLIAAFGRLGLLGGTLDALGIRVGLTQAAVVIAVAYVSSPFYIRQAIAVFEGVDQDLVAAARTLGAGRGRTFFRVVLPLARRGLAAGEALAFARGLGEFGATIMFAGSLQGVTQTLPLAIYQEFALNFNTALAMSAVLVVVSGALLVALRIALQWQPSRPTSRFLFAPSR